MGQAQAVATETHAASGPANKAPSPVSYLVAALVSAPSYVTALLDVLESRDLYLRYHTTRLLQIMVDSFFLSFFLFSFFSIFRINVY